MLHIIICKNINKVSCVIFFGYFSKKKKIFFLCFSKRKITFGEISVQLDFVSRVPPCCKKTILPPPF